MELSLKNLSYYYPYRQLDVLNNLSWEIKSGRLIFLYAPSEGGKTTLLKVIAGRLVPDGQVLLDGVDQACKPMKERRVAYCDDSLMLFYGRSVAYNLAYPLKIRKVKRPERSKLVAAAAEEAGLPIKARAKRLTEIERLKLIFARISIVKRDIILFDDILEAFEDRAAAARLIQEFADKNADKIVIVASSSGENSKLFTDVETFTQNAGEILSGVKKNEFIEEER